MNKSVTQDFILSESTACIFRNSFTVVQEHLLQSILNIIICNQWASYYWHKDKFLKTHTWHIKGFLLSNTISMFNQQIAILTQHHTPVQFIQPTVYTRAQYYTSIMKAWNSPSKLYATNRLHGACLLGNTVYFLEGDTITEAHQL